MKLMKLFAAACALVLAACAYPISTVQQGGEPAMLFFNGAPEGARVIVDGVDAGEASAFDGRRQVLSVEPGRHNVRVVIGGAELYGNDIYVGAGSRLEVRVR